MTDNHCAHCISEADKARAASLICRYADEALERYQDAARRIHAHPETCNEERFACAELSSLLMTEGFAVMTDVAGHSTGFDARYHTEKTGPVITFLAEYDALAGLGHGCGHNLFGATSALAAAALKAALPITGGEVRVYGTPGEEGGPNGSAKGSFVREGYFKDVDAALCVHPRAGKHRLTEPSLGCAPVVIAFHGRAAHAASCPEKGINALDAVIQVYNAVNALRQQLPRDVRIHGIITHGGDAPNIIPAYAEARFYLRAASAPVLDSVYRKMEVIVAGAALATSCTGSMKPSQNRVENTVVTPAFDALYLKHLREFGEDVDASPKAGIGSSDVGNVSQVVPTIQPMISISETDYPGHTPEMVQASCSAKGLASIGLGAKLLALTALDLLCDPDLLAAVKAEHAAAVAAQPKTE